jgi:hypothetical protein
MNDPRYDGVEKLEQERDGLLESQKALSNNSYSKSQKASHDHRQAKGEGCQKTCFYQAFFKSG